MSKITDKFETFDAFLTQAIVRPKQQDSRSSRHYDSGSQPWAGTKTFEQAVDIARRGWPEGAERCLQFRASIADAVREIITSRSHTVSYDVAGQWLDVGRYLGGEPECFGNLEECGETAAKPVVKIVVNIAASGAVSTDAIFARGAVVVAAIDILEAVGRRVEVLVGKGSKGQRGDIHETLVVVKRANQPVDADRLSFAIAHAACLRRLLFSIMEQRGHLPNSTYPHEIVVDEPGTIVTKHARRSTNFSKEELLREVADLCSKAGVEIPEDEIKSLCES